MSTKTFTIEKKELIKGLSLALDLAEQKYMSHSQHIAYLSVVIGKKLELSPSALELLYYSALIHDIGAGNLYELKSHSAYGAEMVSMLPVDTDMQGIIMYHHEFIDGSGPFRLKGESVPLLSQIIHIANQFDYQIQGASSGKRINVETVMQWLQTQCGLFDPKITNAFSDLVEQDEIINEYFSETFNEHFTKVYEPSKILYGVAEIKQFAHVFSELIDKRSSFTHKHSTGLTNIVERMCYYLDFDRLTKDKMYIAALLHDIGKLGIDKTIIDKKGILTTQERKEVELHVKYTYDILGAIKGLEDVALWASQHHEKLNGTGYPNGIGREDLSQQSRVIAVCDIYQALTENRPYRAGMTNEQAFQILQTMVNEGALDSRIVALLISNFSMKSVM